MKINSIAIDTNILIYLHDNSDERKRSIAKHIVAENPKIPSQVISEYLNVVRRLLVLPKEDIVEKCADLLKDCEIIPTSCNTMMMAASLIQKYQFQIFDSIIVAAAIESKCNILYSEDMQHGLQINELRIINPFA